MTNIGEIAGHGHSAGEKHYLISNPRKLQLRRLLTGQRVLGKRNEASWRPWGYLLVCFHTYGSNPIS